MRALASRHGAQGLHCCVREQAVGGWRERRNARFVAALFVRFRPAEVAGVIVRVGDDQQVGIPLPAADVLTRLVAHLAGDRDEVQVVAEGESLHRLLA